MPRGGVRPGAGRKPGGTTAKMKSRVEFMEKALAAGISPLEVMLNTMRDLYAMGEKAEACKIAADAAPYCHSKLASVEHSGPGGEPLAWQFMIGRAGTEK